MTDIIPNETPDNFTISKDLKLFWEYCPKILVGKNKTPFPINIPVCTLSSPYINTLLEATDISPSSLSRITILSDYDIDYTTIPFLYVWYSINIITKNHDKYTPYSSSEFKIKDNPVWLLEARTYSNYLGYTEMITHIDRTIFGKVFSPEGKREVNPEIIQGVKQEVKQENFPEVEQGDKQKSKQGDKSEINQEIKQEIIRIATQYKINKFKQDISKIIYNIEAYRNTYGNVYKLFLKCHKIIDDNDVETLNILNTVKPMFKIFFLRTMRKSIQGIHQHSLSDRQSDIKHWITNYDFYNFP